MSGIAIANRYAKSLFELAQTSNSLDQIEEDLKRLMETVNSSPDLLVTLNNPAISKNTLSCVLSELLKKLNASNLTINFANVLAQNGRTKNLAIVAAAYSALMMKSRGEENAYVTTASALNDMQISDIEKTLGKAIGSKIKVTTHVNERILGGMIVRVGSKMLDASLSGQLNNFNIITKKAIANLN